MRFVARKKRKDQKLLNIKENICRFTFQRVSCPKSTKLETFLVLPKCTSLNKLMRFSNALKFEKISDFIKLIKFAKINENNCHLNSILYYSSDFHLKQPDQIDKIC